MLNQQLEIGGLKARDLCEKYGTPLYVYDAATIARKYERMRKAFHVDKLSIKYACKALSNTHILRYIKSLGAGLDVVSVPELEIGLRVGFEPDQIIFTPNMVSEAEFDRAVQAGVKINVGNLQMLEYLGVTYPGQPVCIRINPHIMAGGNKKIATGHIDSKFGISVHQMPLARRLVETLDIKVSGVHMHNGSDILEADVFLRAADILFSAAAGFADRLEYLDFGSGFKVRYRSDDFETDIEDLGKKMSAKFNRFCQDMGMELELMFEPGKYLVSEAGTFFATVNVVKATTSTVFLGVNSGFNHFMRPMFYDAWHDILNLDNPHGKRKIYTVVGYICETDTFGVNRMMGEARAGDILAFHNAGAYCSVMASNYNSHPRPAEVLVENGRDKLIRRRENLEDLLRTEENV